MPPPEHGIGLLKELLPQSKIKVNAVHAGLFLQLVQLKVLLLKKQKH